LKIKQKEALKKFGDRRTDWEKGDTFQGVETPSQSRFVKYFEIITNELNGSPPQIRTLKLKSIIINSINGVGNGDGSDFSFIVINKEFSVSCTLSSYFNCKVSQFNC
jgi:PTEN homologous phosphatase